MFDSVQMLDIISGRRKGWRAELFRLSLGGLTPVYRLAVALRNRSYDWGWFKTANAGAPVISVGNLTAGGTGKTPMVLWIGRFFLDRGFPVACLSRGYRAVSNSQNDEAMELQHRLKDLVHLQDADRPKIAKVAIQRFGAELLLLDDGFQHRQLDRDLDVVLIDATQPFGFDRLLPRGLMREPISSIRRADVIVLTRGNSLSSPQKMEIQRRIKRFNDHALWVESDIRPNSWLGLDGRVCELATIVPKRLFAFCGIGNPLGFRQTLKGLQSDERCNYEIRGFRSFPDHHHYSATDLQLISDAARESGSEAAVCTHKDLVKLRPDLLGDLPIYALLTDIEFQTGQAEFEKRLLQLVEKKQCSANGIEKP